MSTNLKVANRTRQTELVREGQVAATPWARLMGLLGRRSFEPGDGLLLRHESAIHTFGMSFPIDVVYLDKEGNVLHLVTALCPMRIGPIVYGAKDVLELPPGMIAQTLTHVGDKLEIESVM